MPFEPALDSGESSLSLIPIALREVAAPTDGERHLILNSWLKSFKRNEMVGQMFTETYFENYRPLVQIIIKASKTLFACNPEDPNQLYGFVVYRQLDDVTIISCVYVKHTFRKMGVARRLVEHITRNAEDPRARAFITHAMWWFEETIKRNGLIYNPFLDLKFLGEKNE